MSTAPLTSVEQQTKQRESDTLALLGKICLAMFQREPATQRQMLILAGKYLIEALQASTHNLEAYLYLAYLAYFHQQHEKALAYLKHVLRKAPEHPEARRFLEQLSQAMPNHPLETEPLTSLPNLPFHFAPEIFAEDNIA